MTLRELLKGLEIKEIRGPADVEISGIAYNSRLIKKDFLFVAVSGFVSDGHDYIQDAVRRGAAAVIAEKAEWTDSVEKLVRQGGLSYIVTSDSRKALALIASTYYGRPSGSFPIVAITGTNGKTTTGYITRHILKAWGKDTGLLGTNEYILGERTLDAPRTTPESLDIQRYLREHLKEEISDGQRRREILNAVLSDSDCWAALDEPIEVAKERIFKIVEDRYV